MSFTHMSYSQATFTKNLLFFVLIWLHALGLLRLISFWNGRSCRIYRCLIELFLNGISFDAINVDKEWNYVDQYLRFSIFVSLLVIL